VRIIAVYNIKGGVGKTAGAVNLAWLAAQGGARTLLWDLDPQGAATYTLGVGTRVAGGGRKLVTNPSRLGESIVETVYPGLEVVPADFSLRYLDLELAELKKPRKRIVNMLERVEDRFDFVFLDCPPGITLTIDASLRATDTVLVPVIPAALPLRSFDQLSAYLRADRQLRQVQVLAFLSMVDRRKKRHREMAERLPLDREAVLTGVIPASVHVETMADDRSPVVVERPRTVAAEAFRGLYAELEARIG
jgi:chromosome partitioning protein